MISTSFLLQPPAHASVASQASVAAVSVAHQWGWRVPPAVRRWEEVGSLKNMMAVSVITLDRRRSTTCTTYTTHMASSGLSLTSNSDGVRGSIAPGVRVCWTTRASHEVSRFYCSLYCLRASPNWFLDDLDAEYWDQPLFEFPAASPDRRWLITVLCNQHTTCRWSLPSQIIATTWHTFAGFQIKTIIWTKLRTGPFLSLYYRAL